MAEKAKREDRRSVGSSTRQRRAIVLMTDFGWSGFYVGAMKGAVLAADPESVLVDLTHGIRAYAVAEASFVLSVVFEFFPPGTVFLAVIDPGVGGPRRNLVVASAGRLVVCPDNGLVSDVASKHGVERAYEIDENVVRSVRKHAARGRTFLGRDVFAPAAAFLAAGVDAAAIGRLAGDLVRLALPEVEVRDGLVRGEIRYVDDYGNLLTNITADHLVSAFADADLNGIEVSVEHEIAARGIKEWFEEGAPGELCAILDSWDLVEIAVREGRAADRFGVGRPVSLELARG